MRGAIDFIVIGFGRNDFDGRVLEALEKPVSHGVISILGLALVSKDFEGNITRLSVSEVGDEVLINFDEKHVNENLVDEDDILEVGDLLDYGTAAGLLIIEHLWAKPLKEAIIEKDGFLIAEGRIHPDAEDELE